MTPAHALRALLRASTLALWFAAAVAPAADATKYAPTLEDLLAASTPADWRTPDPEDTLYLELAGGRVVIELAPAFAPLHAANIRTLARAHYYDGLGIIRVQDNYVVQWGDADRKRNLQGAARTLPPEFTRADEPALGFAPLPDRDGYAPEVGFANGFPAARDPHAHTAWLAHCYGMVGAGRDNDVTSGNGAELYVVIGNAPRHLDRNIALVGRVLSGMERLSSLPRGSGAMGFYAKPEQRVPIAALRLAADVPPAQRTDLEVLRTDTPFFRTLVEGRRNRGGDWYKVPAGHIDLCNVPLPVRPRAAGAATP